MFTRRPGQVQAMEAKASVVLNTGRIRTIHFVTYILLLTLEIPSIVCSIFVLIFFVSNWRLLMTKVLHNHAIFLLIIVAALYIAIDLPFTLSHYRLGYDHYRTATFCSWRYWLDYTLLTSSLLLTATASVQRHILVYHSSWLRIRGIRWLLHYLPLIFCVSYPAIFYLIVICFYPCTDRVDPARLSCPLPCYSASVTLFYVDWILHVICPMVVILLANLALICRVVHALEKFRHPQTRIWRKRRKLILQLLAFSTLYVIGWGPTIVISMVEMFFLSDLRDTSPNLFHMNNTSYFVKLFEPFICLFALPELFKFIKKKIRRRRMTIHAVTSVGEGPV